MGVRGLTKYISENEKTYLKPHDLCNCYLVVDGNSAACKLYDWFSKTDSAFGGDYDEYYKVVKDFFQMLERCGVRPIVLFDGGYEKKKIKTVLSRTGEKLYVLKGFSRGHSTAKFFPLFMKQTFMDVMEDLGVICIQCCFEADSEIAAVARALNCPVLSYDSDFYIFDVLYIPLSSLSPAPAKFSHSDDYYIRCSIYDVTNFLKQFSGLDKSMLPIIATLLGNDYIESATFQKFFNHVIMPKSKSKSYTQRKIDGVLHWMKKENVESATELILTHLENKKAGIFLKAIKTSINDYSTCSVSECVVEELTKKLGKLCLNKKEVEMSLLPETLQHFHRCKIHKMVIDIIHLGLYMTQLQVEDINNHSSHLPSLQLITDIYRILTPYSNSKEYLKVYLMLKNFYGFIKIQNTPSECLRDFNLNNVLKQSKETRLELLCQIVGVDKNELSIVTDNWSLFIMSYIYWVRKLKNEISYAHVHALILMAIANQVVQKYVGYYRNVSKFTKKKGKLRETLESTPIPAGTGMDFEGMLADVTLKEKLLVQSALIPYRRPSDLAQGKGYCILTVHLFASFQSVLFHIMQLNALLNFPLPNLKMSEFYSGTLLFNFYLSVKSKPPVEKFGSGLFKDTPNLYKLYDHLQKGLCRYLDKVPPEVKVRKKKKRRNQKVGEKEVMCCRHEEEEEEDGYDDENNPYAALRKQAV